MLGRIRAGLRAYTHLPLERILSRGRVKTLGSVDVPLAMFFRLRRSARMTLESGVSIRPNSISVVEGRVDIGSNSLLRPTERLHVYPRGHLRIGKRCVIEAGARIVVHGELSLGDDVYVGRDAVLVAFERVSIGAGTLLGERVSIHDANHGPPDARQDFQVLPVSIGKQVWLGAGTVVVAGVDVGDRTTVGANAVVTKSLPSGVLAGGVPARVIRPLRERE